MGFRCIDDKLFFPKALRKGPTKVIDTVQGVRSDTVDQP